VKELEAERSKGFWRRFLADREGVVGIPTLR